MTIRFFDSDHSSIIKFEEVDAEWRYLKQFFCLDSYTEKIILFSICFRYSLLESPYGPVDRYDLFLGDCETALITSSIPYPCYSIQPLTKT